MARSDDILRASRVGRWSWLDGRVEWDDTTQQLFDRLSSPTDYAAYLDCLHPDDRAAVHGNIQEFIHKGVYHDIEHRVMLSGGGVRWLFARGTAVFGATGEVRGLEGIVLDITEMKEREGRLVDQAETDPLTGLRNRRWLSHQGPREVARCQRGDAPFSLAYLDLDDFKRINDGPGGHDAGDRVLVEVAACLQAHLRVGDELIRLGGDELMALLPRTTFEEAEVVTHRLAHAIASQPLGGVWSTVSIGISTWESGEDFHTTLRRADRAMYRAKESKKKSDEARADSG